MDTVRLIVTIMFFVALFVPNPYGYYILFRWVICGICAFYVFAGLKTGKYFWVCIFGIGVIINTPILSVRSEYAWFAVYLASWILLQWGVEYAGLDEIGLLVAKSSAKAKNGDEEAQATAEDSASESYQEVAVAEEPEEFKPSGSLKRLYREAAKSFHPDLATNERERERRHWFMAEANQAYQERDEDRLRTVLRKWQCGPGRGQRKG
jgi:hypothetical protein